MPGLEQVYLRQAGTGSAALLGQSSWDPVAFAKYSAGVKAAQDAAKQSKKDKEKDLLLKDLMIKPSKGIAEDRNAINNFGDAFMQWKAQNLLQEGRDLNQNDYNEGIKFKQEWDQLEQDSQLQDKAVTGYLSQLKGANGKLDNQAMMENGAKYNNPEMFMDSDPYIQETFTPVLEYYMRDPFYGQDPQRALVRAKAHWRNEDGRQYITEPILSDASIMDDYRQNVLPLVAGKNKSHIGKTLSDGTYVDENYLYTLQDDVEVETKNGEKIVLYGTRSAELERYDDSPTIKTSADHRFKKQPDDVKQQYIDDYGDEAAKYWNADNISKFGVEVNESSTTRKPAKNINIIGGNKYESPYDILPFTDKANIQWDRDPKNNVGGLASINGFTITQGKGANKKSYTMSGVTPNVVYRQSNGAQVPVEGGYTMDLEDAKIEQIATTNGLTWDMMKKAKVYDGSQTVYDAFMDKWGKQYIKDFGNKGKNGDLAVKDISNIILTDDIANFLSENGLGEYIEDKTYMTGQAKFYKPDKKGDVLIHYSDAVIPVDGTIESKLQTDLELPLNQIVKQQFPPRDWSKGLKTRTYKKKEETFDPNKEIKTSTEVKEGTPELD